jgi:fructose-bisphosphate aldolase class II
VGGKTLDNSQQQASIGGAIAGALHVRALAEVYGVPVVLHTDHAAKKLLPWVDGLLDAGEKLLREALASRCSARTCSTSPRSRSPRTSRSRRAPAPHGEAGHDARDRAGRDRRRRGRRRQHRRRAQQALHPPEDVLAVYDALGPIGSFTVAASFGNTHGVYAPGNVKLKPTILRDSQQDTSSARAAPRPSPVNFVFHGGSGSTPEERSARPSRTAW